MDSDEAQMVLDCLGRPVIPPFGSRGRIGHNSPRHIHSKKKGPNLRERCNFFSFLCVLPNGMPVQQASRDEGTSKLEDKFRHGSAWSDECIHAILW